MFQYRWCCYYIPCYSMVVNCRYCIDSNMCVAYNGCFRVIYIPFIMIGTPCMRMLGLSLLSIYLGVSPMSKGFGGKLIVFG